MTQAADADVARHAPRPTLSELERVRLINLVLQLKLCRTQLEVLTLQFFETPQPRQVKEQIERLTTQINTAVADAFAANGIDAEQFRLDVDRGVFVARDGNESSG